MFLKLIQFFFIQIHHKLRPVLKANWSHNSWYFNLSLYSLWGLNPSIGLLSWMQMLWLKGPYNKTNVIKPWLAGRAKPGQKRPSQNYPVRTEFGPWLAKKQHGSILSRTPADHLARKPTIIIIIYNTRQTKLIWDMHGPRLSPIASLGAMGSWTALEGHRKPSGTMHVPGYFCLSRIVIELKN